MHSCPFCDQACYCKGDWDDADVGHEPAGGCVRYLEGDCGGPDGDQEMEDFEPIVISNRSLTF